MKKYICALLPTLFAFKAAWAQGRIKKGVYKQAADAPTLPEGNVNIGFIIALVVVVGGLICFLVWVSRKKGKRHSGDRSWGNRKSKTGQSSARASRRPAGHPSSWSKLQRQHGVGQNAGGDASSDRELPVVPETNAPTSIPETEAQQPAEIPENTPVETAPAAPPKPAPPQPEIFYMTVPAADGSFPAGAKKMQPSGCLYEFEVQPAKPGEARIRFAGSETDMGNAQAFRDLELLPACTFGNLPQNNRFRFEQTPGRAVLDKEAWVVKDKIAIKFV